MDKQKLIKILKTTNLISLYMVFGTIVTFLVLYYLDSGLLKDEATNLNYVEKGKIIPEALRIKAKIDIPDGVSDISFSYDHNHVSYIEDGIINIKDMKTGKLEGIVVEENPIVHSFFISDRNIILYFVSETKQNKAEVAKTLDIFMENLEQEVAVNPDELEKRIRNMQAVSSKHKIAVKTYDLNKNEKTDHIDFDAPNMLAIKEVQYSSLTNVIYVNVESIKNNKKTNSIYRINIMKRISKYQEGPSFNKMIVLKNEDKLIVEDSLNNLYIDKKQFKTATYKKFKLLGRDNQDNIYLSPMEAPLNILKVQGVTVVQEMLLRDTSPHYTYSNDDGIYMIFKDYIWSVDKNKTLGKTKVGSRNKLLDLFDNAIYELNQENRIEQNIVE